MHLQGEHQPNDDKKQQSINHITQTNSSKQHSENLSSHDKKLTTVRNINHSTADNESERNKTTKSLSKGGINTIQNLQSNSKGTIKQTSQNNNKRKHNAQPTRRPR